MLRPIALFVAVLGLSFGMSIHTRAAADISGHWEGMVQAPEMTLDFHLDVARDGHGGYTGTIGLPAERLKGLPLATIAIEGASVNFSARTDQTFAGTLAADGQAITGEFSMKGGSAPFRLTRTGDARIEPRPASPKISERLAGTWNATLQARQGEVHVVLRLENRADGTAIGSLVNVDEGGLELPLAISESVDTVTLRTTPIDSSFSGALNGDGTVLEGTLRQGTQSVPMTFRRAAAK